MKSARHLLSALLCLVVVSFAASGNAADWIVKRSRYTHGPNSGERVTQYAPIGPFYANDMPNYIKSGFRHSRSSIQVGPSADHLHTIEEWGRPVEPYGAWRYPYRPYSAPYQAWGPPFGGFNVNGGFGFFPPIPFAGPGAGMGGGMPPGGGGPVMGGPGMGGGWAPGFQPGWGGGYNNWTNPFGGPPGVDEYYPDAPSPSRLHWQGPRGF